ncbi:hypothetical protein U1Q18_036569 [Sarracenia purpurea var. burkii]
MNKYEIANQIEQILTKAEISSFFSKSQILFDRFENIYRTKSERRIPRGEDCEVQAGDGFEFRFYVQEIQVERGTLRPIPEFFFDDDLNLVDLDEASEHGIKLIDTGDSDFDIVGRGLRHRRGTLSVLAIHLPPSPSKKASKENIVRCCCEAYCLRSGLPFRLYKLDSEYDFYRRVLSAVVVRRTVSDLTISYWVDTFGILLINMHFLVLDFGVGKVFPWALSSYVVYELCPSDHILPMVVLVFFCLMLSCMFSEGHVLQKSVPSAHWFFNQFTFLGGLKDNSDSELTMKVFDSNDLPYVDDSLGLDNSMLSNDQIKLLMDPLPIGYNG